MLTELATRMDPAVSVLPDCATIAVLGLGYVGLPVALTCAEAGFRVVGIDSDPDRVRVLREADVDAALAASVFHSGKLPIPALKRELRTQGIEVRE